MSGITKAERAELRSVVRGQCKVLRSEIEQRKAELVVELDQEIHDRFGDEDRRRAAVEDRIAEIAAVAEREITDLLLSEDLGVSISRPYRLSTPVLNWPQEGRNEMRRLGLRQIDARVRDAQVRLDRQEADLLRTLSIDAIESDDAKAFLAAIPTVGELVPSARMDALGDGEAS